MFDWRHVMVTVVKRKNQDLNQNFAKSEQKTM